MAVMVEEAAPVWGGVDTHAEFHVAAVTDRLGGVLGTERFSADCSGESELAQWLASFGDLILVGVEGTGSYGRRLSKRLVVAGIAVVEVDRPNRQQRRREGKTDVFDAIEAARAALSGRAFGVPKSGDGLVEAIRVLQAAKRSARKARTAAISQIRQLVVTSNDSIHAQLHKVSTAKIGTVSARLRPAVSQGPVIFATKTAIRTLGRRVIYLETELNKLDTQLEDAITQIAPDLLTTFGVGINSAAELLICAGDNPERLNSEASFAALCGVAPIPASSGKTIRWRLNRGGNRNANAALCDPPWVLWRPFLLVSN